jgi:uncharacterized membrane protein YqaE (UPF0057 family)
MNKISLFILLAAVIGFSSCQSLRIEKRHYNNGWYVDFGNEKNPQGSVVHSESEEETVVVAEESAPTETKSSPALVVDPNTTNTEQMLPSSGSYVVTVSPETTTEPTTEHSTTKESKQAEVQKPEAQKENAPAAGDAELILMVILAILLPPLAVYLAQGLTKWFWVTLILCIFGGGVFFYPVIGGLWLVAVIIALLVVFGSL